MIEVACCPFTMKFIGYLQETSWTEECPSVSSKAAVLENSFMLTRSGIFNEGCRHARRCRGSGKCLLLVESFMLIVHSSQEYDEEYLEDAEESVSLLFVHGASNSTCHR